MEKHLLREDMSRKRRDEEEEEEWKDEEDEDDEKEGPVAKREGVSKKSGKQKVQEEVVEDEEDLGRKTIRRKISTKKQARNKMRRKSRGEEEEEEGEEEEEEGEEEVATITPSSKKHKSLPARRQVPVSKRKEIPKKNRKDREEEAFEDEEEVGRKNIIGEISRKNRGREKLRRKSNEEAEEEEGEEEEDDEEVVSNTPRSKKHKSLPAKRQGPVSRREKVPNKNRKEREQMEVVEDEEDVGRKKIRREISRKKQGKKKMGRKSGEEEEEEEGDEEEDEDEEDEVVSTTPRSKKHKSLPAKRQALEAAVSESPSTKRTKRTHQPGKRGEIVTRHTAELRRPDEEVYFDLETTGIPHITQIGAIKRTGETFNKYVTPEKPIEPMASHITGITSKNGKVFYTGKQVNAIPIKKALVKFRAFLGDTNVIIVGHNAHGFDGPILRQAAAECGMLSQFEGQRCLDTFPLFRECYPGLPSYKQPDLVARFVGESYQAHGALEDAKALKRLVSAARIPPQAKIAHTKTLGSTRYR